MGEIYKVTNLINQKIYIGLTQVGVQNRWKRHINTAYSTTSKDYNEPFKKAIRKYGKDNFSIEVIDTAETLEELKEKEKYWIKQYNSCIYDQSGWGYNATRGGDSPTQDYTCVKIKRVNIMTGQIDEHYNSIAQAERKYHRGIREIFINNATTQIPKGYTWLKEQEKYNQNDMYFKFNIICQLDLQGKLIKYWLNCDQIEKELNINISNIRSCLVGKRDKSHQYQWCYYKNLPNKINKPYINQNSIKKQKQVAQYDLCNNLLHIWNSATQAANATNTHISKISAVCNGKRKTSNGFKWKYI